MKAMRLALLAAVVAVMGGVGEAKAGFAITIREAGSLTGWIVRDGSSAGGSEVIDGVTYTILADNDGLTNSFIQLDTISLDGLSIKLDGDFTSTNSPGDSILGSLTLNGVAKNTNTSTKTYIIDQTSTEFTAPPPPVNFNATYTLNTPNNSSNGAVDGKFDSYIVDGSDEFGTSANAISYDPGKSKGPLAGGGSYGSVNYGTGYTLTNTVTLALDPTTGTGTGARGTTFDVTLSVTAVPAPMGLILLASGAPLMGLMGWMRRRRSSEIAA